MKEIFNSVSCFFNSRLEASQPKAEPCFLKIKLVFSSQVKVALKGNLFLKIHYKTYPKLKSIHMFYERFMIAADQYDPGL